MPLLPKDRIQREGAGWARFYIEVADEEGGRFRPDPDSLEMFVLQDLAERAAENALQRFPVARVLEEKLTMRRKSEVEAREEKPQIQVGNIELDKRLDRGKTIAVIYRRQTYGEPDYRVLAREMVVNAAIAAMWPIEYVKSRSVELVSDCRIILIDEVAQDEQSRGYSFDRVYVMPPAELIGDGVRRALVPR